MFYILQWLPVWVANDDGDTAYMFLHRKWYGHPTSRTQTLITTLSNLLMLVR